MYILFKLTGLYKVVCTYYSLFDYYFVYVLLGNCVLNTFITIGSLKQFIMIKFNRRDDKQRNNKTNMCSVWI